MGTERAMADTVQDEIRRQIMDHIGRLETSFREMDPEGKGYVSHLDFRKALYLCCGLPYSAVGVLMGDMPTTGGMVDYTKWSSQFVASSRRTAGLTQEYVPPMTICSRSSSTKSRVNSAICMLHSAPSTTMVMASCHYTSSNAHSTCIWVCCPPTWTRYSATSTTTTVVTSTTTSGFSSLHKISTLAGPA